MVYKEIYSTEVVVKLRDAWVPIPPEVSTMSSITETAPPFSFFPERTIERETVNHHAHDSADIGQS